MRRWIALASVSLLLTAASCARPADRNGDEPRVEVASELRVRVGARDPENPSISINAFLPQAVAPVNGRTVTWEFAGPEPHSVTYFPPGERPKRIDLERWATPLPVPRRFDGTQPVHSGLLSADGKPATFSLRFPEVGSYTFRCILHPQMRGFVNVTSDATEADLQENATQNARNELSGYLREGRRAAARLAENGFTKQPTPDGTEYRVRVGAGTQRVNVLAFGAATIRASRDDRITFVNESSVPHTVTFPGSSPLPAPLDPRASKPTPRGPEVWLRTGRFVNSGLLAPALPEGKPPPNAQRRFTVVLEETGTFEFVCLLHATSGMAGEISTRRSIRNNLH